MISIIILLFIYYGTSSYLLVVVALSTITLYDICMMLQQVQGPTDALACLRLIVVRVYYFRLPFNYYYSHSSWRSAV